MNKLVCALAITLSAFAASAADAPVELAACKADAERLCPGVQAGDGRIAACIKDKRKDLSAECKKELAAARKNRKPA